MATHRKRPDSLTEYRRKRDFTATSEPRGAIVRPAHVRRFMIHKHHATRLHYDLRLEIGGALASWAVPKGPTLDPGEKRLAAQVEDHPIEYGTFEGVIPEGNYGAGPSLIWDEGVFTVEGEETPEQQLANGELKLVLLGRKMKGGFVLVKLRGKRSAAKDWLLIKRRDAYAVPGWTEAGAHAERSVKSGLTVEELRAGKRPKKKSMAPPRRRRRGRKPA